MERNFDFKDIIALSRKTGDFVPFDDFTSTSGDIVNRICGDSLCVVVSLQSDIIKKIGFSGEACTITKASAVRIAQELIGKNIKDYGSSELYDVVYSMGFNQNSLRLGCAELSIEAYKKALQIL